MDTYIQCNIIHPWQEFVTTWMDFEGIMRNEISQTEKDKYHMISLHVELIKTEFIETENRLVVCLRSGWGGMGSA